MEIKSNTLIKSRRVKIGLLIGATLVATLLAIALWPGEGEPKYKGHKLTWWLGIKRPPGVTITKEEYREAVHGFGTNAIPYILKKIRLRQPEWRRTAVQAYLKWPRPLVWAWVAESLYSPDAETMAFFLPHWFTALGADGAPAVPELISILEDPKSGRQTRLIAMDWLRKIGEPARPALPSLQKLQSDKDPVVQDRANETFLWLRSNGVRALRE